METEDNLKKILGKLDLVNDPIDIESDVLKAITENEISKNKIADYKSRGVKALKISAFLIILLGMLLSMSSSLRSLEHSIATYSSVILVLIILFIQLEIGGTKVFDNQ
jgi:hypothetical protein